jgi:carbonic anhydrase
MPRYLKIILPFVFMWSTSLRASEGPEWNYEKGDYGPEYWGLLATEFDMCSRGKNQSPIDLVTDIQADLPELVFDYTKFGDINEINTGHAIQENVTPGNYILISGERFELKQFHFHSPSEHRVNGKTYPMEIHLVHQNVNGSYVVVGFFVTEGPPNEVMDRLPSFRAERGETPYTDPVDFNELIVDRENYFYYNGSLTTPPCTEGVTWIVLQAPVFASAEQMNHYYDLLGFDNNRPLQPKNSRLVLD